MCHLSFSFVLLLFPCAASLYHTNTLFHPYPLTPYLCYQWILHRVISCLLPIANRIPNLVFLLLLQSMGEVNGRVDQLALVQQALQDGATPTMITGFAMIVAQMQAQATHPEVLLTITSSIGPLERSATFRDGVWDGYDLTHNLIDHRSHMLYGEPDRPPMDQEQSFRISRPTIQPIFQPTQPTPPQTMIQLPPRDYNF